MEGENKTPYTLVRPGKAPSGKGRRIVWDIETDGLLRQLTRVHLIVCKDIDTDEIFVFRENSAVEGARFVMDAELNIGHNTINFDIPALKKLFPWFEPQGRIRDTILCTRLIFSDVKERDYDRVRRGEFPPKYIGAHSLGAWGYRLGEYKDDYDGGWEKWSQDMETYAVQDVVVTSRLWDLIEQQDYPEEPIVFEHRFADLMALQERNGFVFDREGAEKLYAELSAIREDLSTRLKAQFGFWYQPSKWESKGREKIGATQTPNKTLNYKDPLKASRVEGCPFTPIKRIDFNPGSRDQIANRLQTLFGWVPKEFTETGKPKVSEDILRDLVGTLDEEADGVEESEDELYSKFITSIPQAKDLADFFLIQKRIGQLAEGKNGWLKLVEDDGRIHGSINTLGAVSRRGTHSKPNVSQTPAVRSPYGTEMRALWTVEDGWFLVGGDLSGIEIRAFAHALAEFDGGAYADVVINGDVHTHNQNAFGVPTRDMAKTTLYATLIILSLRPVTGVENRVNSVETLT